MTDAGRFLRSTGLALLIAGCGGVQSDAPLETASSAASASAVGSPAESPAPSPPAPQTPSAAPRPPSAILAGKVDRSSLDVTATYDVEFHVVVGTGAITVTTVIEARNDSGAGIDRLELNTIAARLGGLVVRQATVDDRPATVETDDQTLIVPLGGILPDGRTVTVRLGYSATLTPDLDASDWLFSRAGGTLALYRWIPWASRAVPFDRPNHGDPFVTPSSPLVRVRVTTDVPATWGGRPGSKRRSNGSTTGGPATSANSSATTFGSKCEPLWAAMYSRVFSSLQALR